MIPAVHIYDCNNYVRRRHEVDPSGMTLRNLFNDAYYSPNPTIYVFDGKNAKAARKAIYPDYKANRIAAPDSFYAVLEMFKELVGHTNKILLEIPGFEADDVIANLVRSHPTTPKKIFSNDGDFMQLVNEYVTVSDPKLQALPVGEIRLYKTLVGDPSDNIKGISKFGDAAWAKLTPEQKNLWELWLENSLETPDLPAQEALGLGAAQYKWFVENRHILRGYWQIVNFLPVPAELIQKHMVVGKPNLALANELLKGVFQ